MSAGQPAGARVGAGPEGGGVPTCLTEPGLGGCRWSLTHSERYALQFADGHRKYITETVSPHSPSHCLHSLTPGAHLASPDSGRLATPCLEWDLLRTPKS